MNKPTDPLNTPLTWRAFLYNDILLQWETKVVNIRTEVYNKKAIANNIGLLVVKKSNLAEMRAVEEEYRRSTSEFLVFYANSKAYEALFKRLRDTVAHGHYAADGKGWLNMRHCYQDRGEKKPSPRLIGHMKFSTLKQLVKFVSRT